AAVVTPDRTRSWVPVAHATLLDSVRLTLAGAGLHVVAEAHGLTRGGNRYFGLLQVSTGLDPSDFGLVVGIRNSPDRSFPAALALGGVVFVCSNLSFSGQVVLARKHTAHIERDLPQLVARSVGLLGGLREAQERRFLTYRSHELTDAQVHDALIRALDA